MSRRIKKQIPGEYVDPVPGGKNSGSSGKSGDPHRRALEIARRRPELPARKLAKIAGVSIKEAKTILDGAK
jgi:hypothetical protein